MNALRWITTEAKKIKRRFPHRFKKWTQYVAQASAIYASKHKGKSPIGHKRKKIGMARKRKRSATVKRIRKFHAAEGRAIRSLGSIKTRLRKNLEERVGREMYARHKAKTKRAKKKITKRISANLRTIRNL
jgi:hypothetical protein